MPKWILPLLFALPHLAISVRLPKRYQTSDTWGAIKLAKKASVHDKGNSDCGIQELYGLFRGLYGISQANTSGFWSNNIIRAVLIQDLFSQDEDL